MGDVKQFESDVETAAEKVRKGGSTTEKIEDGSSCFVICHTAVESGKAEEAAKNVRQNFDGRRRRLGSQNAGVEISSTQTFEEVGDGSENDENEGGSKGQNDELSAASTMTLPSPLAILIAVVAMM